MAAHADLGYPAKIPTPPRAQCAWNSCEASHYRLRSSAGVPVRRREDTVGGREKPGGLPVPAWPRRIQKDDGPVHQRGSRRHVRCDWVVERNPGRGQADVPSAALQEARRPRTDLPEDPAARCHHPGPECQA